MENQANWRQMVHSVADNPRIKDGLRQSMAHCKTLNFGG